MLIEEPSLEGREPAAFLRLGFRPFYLAAATFAVVSVPIWLASYFNVLHNAKINLLWHMHEMVYGFAMAVVIGFLFTAARNWTGLWTPRGNALATFAALWILGRVGMATGPTYAAALLDFPFVPLAAIALSRVMVRSGKKRNLPLVGILALVSICNLIYHLSAIGVVATGTFKPLRAALLLIVLLSTVMGSRVIPSFTTAATAFNTSTSPRIDMLAFVAIAACFFGSIVGMQGSIVFALSIVGAAAHFFRMRGWGSSKTANQPLLWILHLSFFWIGAGVVLLGIAALTKSSTSTALHALSLGTMASLIIGMMARTTRGHTGQKMVSSKADILMFSAIQLATLTRVSANLSSEGLRTPMLLTSASLWSAAFFVYITKFGPALFRPRQDGREG